MPFYQTQGALGRYAAENGVIAAKRRFSAKLKLVINESAVRRFKNESVRKRECEDSDGEVEELYPSKRGRKVKNWTVW